MKEFTIEQKAKFYDEAVKRGLDYRQDIFEAIFPELADSEDERIRKGIIDVVKGNMPDNDYRKKYLDWLEKQRQDNIIESLRLEYEKGKADGLSEQRKEWTAEDLLNRNEIYDILDDNCRDDLIDWLHEQLCMLNLATV